MDKYIGTLLDNRYEVLEIIGVGGMAVVYRARCRVLNRFVAIKILKDEYAQDEEFRRRFYIESQAVAKLSHNNIVSVYDVSHTEGLDYIVMELIEGITLKDYLQKKGHLSWQETIFFAQQIARALGHAHSRGIIHQDIKPQNVIILQDGTAKVTDFGIASFAGNQETKVIQEAIGSVHYISPEQAKGSRIDFRTDLYSLGVVMYEMLTGQLPFTGETPLAIVMQHISAVPLMPSEIVPGVPPGMDQIVMHAMCATVEQRYATAEELLADLTQLKNDPTTIFRYSGAQIRGEDAAMDETQPIADYHELRRQEQMKQTQEPHTRSSGSSQRSTVQTHTRYTPQKQGFFEKMSESPTMLAGFAVGCFVIVALVVAGILMFSGGSSTKKYEVPSFLGQNIDDVLTGEYQQIFNLKRGQEVASDVYAKGLIVAQSEEEGTKLTTGATIKLDVSTGPADGSDSTGEDFKISDYTEQKLDTVETILKRDNVLYTVKQEASDSVAEGYITRTEPAAGEVLKNGEYLTVYVSKGSDSSSDDNNSSSSETSESTARMPNVIGSTLTEAKKTLSAYGISVKKTTKVESTEPEGTVVSQSIEQGTEVKEGDKVTLEISSGVAPAEEKKDEDTTKSDSNTTSSNNSTANSSQPMGSATFSVAIPPDAQNSSAHIVVTLDDGTTAYDQVLESPGTMVSITVQGSGSRMATVSVNGTNTAETPIVFN